MISEVWTKSKLLVKVGVIALIILLLMIPAYQVQELVTERQTRQQEAVNEISSKWAGKQMINGPVLVLPFYQLDKDARNNPVQVKHYAYFLPSDLNIQSSVTPKEKYRGMYKVMLYSTKVHLAGTFSDLHPERLKIAPESILWSEAFLRMNVSDLKGLNEELSFKWNNAPLTFSPGSPSDPYQSEGLTAPLNIAAINGIEGAKFSADLDLNGSQQLLFAPIGKSTAVQVQSQWPHPSFTGDALPQTTSVKESGFIASWRSLSHKRDFPQQFRDDDRPSDKLYNFNASSFGVDLFVPVNAYQKTMRSVKYALLCIVLTFSAFFIIEMVNKKSVHPFQYGLIGLALILFYTLLLSFSEYIGFNPAYLVASLATIALIGWFVKGVLQSGRLSIILSAVLALMYGYVFTILQLQDFALLLGSIGLFLTLAIIISPARSSGKPYALITISS